MTEPYFYEDAYAQTISAVVTQVRDTSVSLDRTIFYPLEAVSPEIRVLFMSTARTSPFRIRAGMQKLGRFCIFLMSPLNNSCA